MRGDRPSLEGTSFDCDENEGNIPELAYARRVAMRRLFYPRSVDSTRRRGSMLQLHERVSHCVTVEFGEDGQR